MSVVEDTKGGKLPHAAVTMREDFPCEMLAGTLYGAAAAGL